MQSAKAEINDTKTLLDFLPTLSQWIPASDVPRDRRSNGMTECAFVIAFISMRVVLSFDINSMIRRTRLRSKRDWHQEREDYAVASRLASECYSWMQERSRVVS